MCYAKEHTLLCGFLDWYFWRSKVPQSRNFRISKYFDQFPIHQFLQFGPLSQSIICVQFQKYFYLNLLFQNLSESQSNTNFSGLRPDRHYPNPAFFAIWPDFPIQPKISKSAKFRTLNMEPT